MTGPLLTTPLHAWHAAHGARLVDFAGWSMPLQFTSIIEEHRATRRAAGLFDISHMGRLLFQGPGAEAFLDRLVTRRVVGQPPGRIRYALVANDQGGIRDDVLVYRLDGEGGRPVFLLVVNAGNREKILRCVQAALPAAEGVSFSDRTLQTAMIAVQGPRAVAAVAAGVAPAAAGLKYYRGAMATIQGRPGVVSRTGYTGEDGCELIVEAALAESVWQTLLAAAAADGMRPAGLGARDTLRLEAGMPLYGHELDETIDPYQAGLGYAVEPEGRTFPGREVLVRLREATPALQRVGLELGGRRVPREGCPVLAGESAVGRVTSGTFSPTLDRPIAMAYVPPAAAVAGTSLQVDIRGRREAVRVVALPFYSRVAG